MSIGFDHDRGRRQRELTNNKNINGKNHVRIYLRVIFGLAENVEKGTSGLGHKLTLTRNSDNSALNKTNATIVGKSKIKTIEWYVPHYTPTVSNQAILSKQILSRVPTELQYLERSVSMKVVNTQNIWIFE